MLKLKAITLRNWSRVKTAELQFPAQGLVHVHGPFGSGKTSLGEAINCTLLGAALSPNLLDCTRNCEGDMYVQLDAELNAKPLRVELGHSCAEFPDATGEGLRFTYDGKTTERPRATQTRAELSAMLGVSPEVSMWTVFLDGERLKFRNLSQAAALDLLMQAMNQPPWDTYKQRADHRRETLQVDVTQKAAKLMQLKTTQNESASALDEAQDTVALEKRKLDAALAAWADTMDVHRTAVEGAANRVTAADAERKRVRKAMADAEKADAAKYGELELTLTRLAGERRTADTYWHEWQEIVAQHSTDQRHASSHLRLLREGKKCPTCSQAVQAKASADVLAKAQADLEKIEKSLKEATSSRDDCRSCLDSIDKEIAGVRQKQRQLKSDSVGDLSGKLEIAEAALERAGRELDRLEKAPPRQPSDELWQQAKTVLAERSRQHAVHEAAIRSAAEELADAEHKLSLVKYWCKGFSPEGIPNLVLRRTVGPLNDAARLISESLSGGKVRVSFGADVELASGATKPKLVTCVEAVHGAPKLHRHSKGESGLINLIIAETQTQVGRVLQRVNYRWCDELLNAVGSSVRQSVYAHLRRQAGERGLLTFVVDHHPEIAAVADHALQVDKDAEGSTTFAWQGS